MGDRSMRLADNVRLRATRAKLEVETEHVFMLEDLQKYIVQVFAREVVLWEFQIEGDAAKEHTYRVTGKVSGREMKQLRGWQSTGIFTPGTSTFLNLLAREGKIVKGDYRALPRGGRRASR